jgi:tRNA (guanine26-N2/guanine27-N2)-dimethyltransferase
MALRQQIGLVARQAWMLGRGLQPLFSFSEGRTFRLALRLRRQIQRAMNRSLGWWPVAKAAVPNGCSLC